MAHRYGGFHDSCTELEVVTGTGKVVRCSREQDSELFAMMHGSYGTLGIITQITFDLPVDCLQALRLHGLSSLRQFR